jgi:hypothetical protein
MTSIRCRVPAVSMAASAVCTEWLADAVPTEAWGWTPHAANAKPASTASAVVIIARPRAGRESDGCTLFERSV